MSITVPAAGLSADQQTLLAELAERPQAADAFMREALALLDGAAPREVVEEAALRALLAQRMKGPFVPVTAGSFELMFARFRHDCEALPDDDVQA